MLNVLDWTGLSKSETMVPGIWAGVLKSTEAGLRLLLTGGDIGDGCRASVGTVQV